MAASLPLGMATPGAGGLTAAAVTAVGDKAFVLKDGVWIDTTFDPTAMTTTELPFPSDLFLEFLGDHPDMGKYFALGERVIVVLDGVAYETVPGDVAAIESEANTPQGGTGAEAELTTSSQPQPDTSSPPASSPLPFLTADVTEGVAPLEVNFTGTLAAGSDNARVYACQAGEFEFGDGNSLSIMVAACDPEKDRDDAANYVYEEPGEYQVTYALGELKSEPVTIVVKESAGALDPTDTPESSATPTALVPAEATPASQSAPATAEPVQVSQSGTEAGGSPFNFWGFLLLPLLGLAVGWFIWGRARNR
jgi:PKD repeat protein